MEAWLLSILTDPSSLLDSSWNRSLLKWQMIWTSRQEMQGPQPPSQCSAQHYVRMALWCSKAGHVRSWRCPPPRLASTATPRLAFHISTSCLPPPHTPPMSMGLPAANCHHSSLSYLPFFQLYLLSSLEPLPLSFSGNPSPHLCVSL